MARESRRQLIRWMAAAGVVATAGCSVGSHHDADIHVSNDSTQTHRVSVTLARANDGNRIRKRSTLQPDEDVAHEGAIPNPANEVHRYRVSVSLGDGVDETTTISLGDEHGFHQLGIRIESTTDASIQPIVH